MADFPQHSADLAYALRKGDIAEAEMVLDLMERDNTRPCREEIAKGRARADRELGRLEPLPQLSQPDLPSTAHMADAIG